LAVHGLPDEKFQSLKGSTAQPFMSANSGSSDSGSEFNPDDPCDCPESMFEFFRTHAFLQRFMLHHPESAFLFVGNRVFLWWLFLSVTDPELSKRSRAVPFSLQEYLMEVAEDDQYKIVAERLNSKACKSLFPNTGVEEDWIKQHRDVYVVDFAFSGRSLKAMTQLVRTCFPSLRDVHILNLHGEGIASEEDHIYRYTTGNLPESVEAPDSAMGLGMRDILAETRYPRLVPKYPPSKWSKPPMFPKKKSRKEQPFDAGAIVSYAQRGAGFFPLQNKSAKTCVDNLRNFYYKVWIPLKQLVASKNYSAVHKFLVQRGLSYTVAPYIRVDPTGKSSKPDRSMKMLRNAMSGKVPHLSSAEDHPGAPYSYEVLYLDEEPFEEMQQRRALRKRLLERLLPLRRAVTASRKRALDAPPPKGEKRQRQSPETRTGPLGDDAALDSDTSDEPPWIRAPRR
jgi:hypothetical protein